MPFRLRHEFGDEHGNAHGRENHDAVSARGIVVIGLLAMFEAAEQRRKSEDPVDIEHYCRIDRIAHQRRRGLAGHHDGEDDDLDQHRRKRQDHRAVGITHFGGKHLGMMGDPHGSKHDRRHHQGRTDERCGATGLEQMMLDRDAGKSSEKSGDEMPFRSQVCKQARLLARSEAVLFSTAAEEFTPEDRCICCMPSFDRIGRTIFLAVLYGRKALG